MSPSNSKNGAANELENHTAREPPAPEVFEDIEWEAAAYKHPLLIEESGLFSAADKSLFRLLSHNPSRLDTV